MDSWRRRPCPAAAEEVEAQEVRAAAVLVEVHTLYVVAREEVKEGVVVAKEVAVEVEEVAVVREVAVRSASVTIARKRTERTPRMAL